MAIAANVSYPSSPWFLAGTALGGVFIFLSWNNHVTQSEAGNTLYPVIGVVSSVLALLAEIERPLVINVTCGYSVLGAVMFGLLEIARRRRGKNGLCIAPFAPLEARAADEA